MPVIWSVSTSPAAVIDPVIPTVGAGCPSGGVDTDADVTVTSRRPFAGVPTTRSMRNPIVHITSQQPPLTCSMPVPSALIAIPRPWPIHDATNGPIVAVGLGVVGGCVGATVCGAVVGGIVDGAVCGATEGAMDVTVGAPAPVPFDVGPAAARRCVPDGFEEFDA